MKATNRPCPSCRAETTLGVVQDSSGQDDPLEVTLRALPVLRCAQGHTHFVTIDFPRKLLEHLVKEDERQLPAAEKKGLIFKHFLCADCGEELLPKPDHRHMFEVDLDLPDVAPFVVQLSMPVYRCSGCAKEQLHSLIEIQSHTPGALAKAFEAAGIAREG